MDYWFKGQCPHRHKFVTQSVNVTVSERGAVVALLSQLCFCMEKKTYVCVHVVYVPTYEQKYVWVCMHIATSRTHTSLCVCIHIYIYICIYTYIHVHAHRNQKNLCINIHVHAHRNQKNLCIYLCMCVCVCMLVCIHTSTHGSTCIHNVHAYTHMLVHKMYVT